MAAEAAAPNLASPSPTGDVFKVMKYRRGKLPHIDSPELIQMITFRLEDSLPEQAIRRLRIDAEHFARAIHDDALLDEGYGSCILGRAECADIIEEVLIEGHGKTYALGAWVVMPNHVHVLARIREGAEMAKVVRRWKGVSSRRVHQLVGGSGTLWGRSYYDRYIRDADHWVKAVQYIHDNPVRAGLCERTEDWPFSSAHPSKTWEPREAVGWEL